MYQAIAKNQENIQTRPQTSLIILFDQAYFNSCTKLQKRILQYFQTFRFKINKIRHQVVADAVGCSIKTVQRATNKFMEDGVLFKKQPHYYSSNKYTWGSNAFSINQEDKFFSKKLLHREMSGVLNIKRSLLKSGSGLVLVTSRACARTAKNLPETRDDQALKCNLKPETRDQKPGNKNQRPETRYQKPETKNQKGVILESDEAKLNELKIELDKYFDLTPVEEFNLMVFPYEALQAAYKELQSFLKRKNGGTLDDSFGWFISRCKKYCTAHNLTVNWRIFYDNCRLAGLDPKTKSKPRPVVVHADEGRAKVRKSTGSTNTGIYSRYEPNVPTVDEEIAKYEKSIKVSTEVLNDPDHPKRFSNVACIGEEPRFKRNNYPDELLKEDIERDKKYLQKLYDRKKIEEPVKSEQKSEFKYEKINEEEDLSIKETSELQRMLGSKTGQKMIGDLLRHLIAPNNAHS